jgi:purine-binding chemotaxis protein CheW
MPVATIPLVLPDIVVPSTKRVLVVLARTNRCALPLEHVVETMRPLRIEPVANAPPQLLGISIVRGIPLPVVDLGALLGSDGARSSAAIPARFVTVRAGARCVALAVEFVVGVRNLAPGTLHQLPPLLGGVPSAAVTALGVLDRELVAVLDGSRLLPDDVWALGMAAAI